MCQAPERFGMQEASLAPPARDVYAGSEALSPNFSNFITEGAGCERVPSAATD